MGQQQMILTAQGQVRPCSVDEVYQLIRQEKDKHRNRPDVVTTAYMQGAVPGIDFNPCTSPYMQWLIANGFIVVDPNTGMITVF